MSKKKLEKWPYLDQNHGLTPLEKLQFCFYSLERRFFVLQYRKSHFPNLYCLKKKVGKMLTFGPKPWVNPFGKISTFSTYWTSCFYSLERRLFVLEYRKRLFPNQYCLKKRLEKSPYLDQNHGLTLLEKCKFFDFLCFLFLQPRKAFFRSRIS